MQQLQCVPLRDVIVCQQRLQIPLDDCDWCAQLVRDIGDEGTASVVGALEPIDHVVELQAYGGKLILPAHPHAPIQIALAHQPRGRRELIQPRREPSRPPDAEGNAQQHRR